MKTRIFGYRIVIRMVMVFALLFTLTGCGDNKVKDTQRQCVGQDIDPKLVQIKQLGKHETNYKAE